MVDLYPKGDPGDTVWVPAIAQRSGSWRVLSGDRKLLTTPQNRAAIVGSGLTLFLMPSGFPDLTKWEQGAKMFRWFPMILAKAGRAKAGEFFEVKMNGQILERK
jgi:hypothetical protein